VIWRKVKTGGHEARWSQIYHCLYCYFTGHFSIILNEFSFNHLLLFLLLTDVNGRILQNRGENGPGHRATQTTASEAEYNDEPYNKPP
jgi:hypothetical protein